MDVIETVGWGGCGWADGSSAEPRGHSWPAAGVTRGRAQGAPPPHMRRPTAAAQYPWSGKEVVHGRRDKRKGSHSGRVTRSASGAPCLL